MKKLALIATLAMAATAASAADYSAFTTYDYDNVSGLNGVALHRGTIGGKAGFGKYGSVDAGITGVRLNAFGQHVTDQGLEVGYSNGLKFGKIGVNGRVAVGQLNESNTDTLRLQVEGTYPVTASVTAVAGAEHLRTEGNADANRFIVGADVVLTKQVTARAAYARSNVIGAGGSTDGLSLGVNYKF